MGFGRIAIRTPETSKFWRISRRQASQLPRWCDIPAAWVPHKAHAVFYSKVREAPLDSKRLQSRVLHGGVVPSRHSAGPASRFVAPGLSACVTLPSEAPSAAQPDAIHAAMSRLNTIFMVPSWHGPWAKRGGANAITIMAPAHEAKLGR